MHFNTYFGIEWYCLYIGRSEAECLKGLQNWFMNWYMPTIPILLTFILLYFNISIVIIFYCTFKSILNSNLINHTYLLFRFFSVLLNFRFFSSNLWCLDLCHCYQVSHPRFRLSILLHRGQAFFVRRVCPYWTGCWLMILRFDFNHIDHFLPVCF